MILYNKSFLRIGEVWFDSEANGAPVDVVCYRFSKEPRSAAVICRPFYTICLDLGQDQDTLFAGMKKETRYEIRRAAHKDKLVYKGWGSNYQNVLPQFVEFYNSFAAQKGLLPMNRSRLMLYADNGVLDISQVCDEQGQPLVWHVFCRGTTRTQLLYSPSLFRASDDSAYRHLVGRANRYHHWQDILRFKAEGLTTYGLGSWYQGTADRSMLSLNKFKSNFGGQLTLRFECKRALTIKGRLALLAERLLRGGVNGHAKSYWGPLAVGRFILETLL